MDAHLGLTSHDYSLAIVIFQLGYVFFQVPSKYTSPHLPNRATDQTLTFRSMVLSRTRPSLWIPTLMVLWGTVVALTALVKTPAQLIGMRFLLGVTQAGFSPAVIFMISTWYCRREQSKRFMCYLSGVILSGAFGGSIAGAIVGNLDGAHGVAGWRW
jgi:MFS family permease